MFQQRLRPLELLERRVVALRHSLNAPVVATAELPEGAARAAILVYLEEGQRRVIVVLRSLVHPRLVQYELHGEDLEESTGVAYDAALSFAESMGFVFDDECVASTEGEERAAVLKPLRQLLDTNRSLVDQDEIMLDAVDEKPIVEQLSPALPGAELSKFRAGTTDPPTPTQGETGPATTKPATTLGRVRPVRKRAQEAAPSLPPKLRLLASF